MDTKTTAQPKATIRAVVTHADGRVEDLGVIATTETKPGLLRNLKDAWIEGWHEGSEQKDGA